MSHLVLDTGYMPGFPNGDFRDQLTADFQRTVQGAMGLYEFHGSGSKWPDVPCCLQPWEILAVMNAAKASPPGSFVEVGVYWGGLAWHLTQLGCRQQRGVYLYDTFEGLVDKAPVDVLQLGHLKTDEATVRATVGTYPYLEKCVFPRALSLPTQVAFAHIDVDQYQSTKDTAVALHRRMAPGGIMWFDDTAGGPHNGLEGARQAVRELYDGCIEIDPTTQRWFVRF